MKKRSVLEIVFLAVLFGIFLLSSLDNIGNIKVLGFTVRFVYLFVLIGGGLASYRWIKQKKINLPEGILFLGIWTALILAFIPNTPLVIRNVGYAGWLLLNVMIVFFMVTFITKDNKEDIIRLYTLSFFILAIIGLIQYITPQIGLPPIFVSQWWVRDILPRVHAFTYEPSYYATYLFLGIPLTMILLALGKLAGLPKWLFYTMIATEVIAFSLCFSRVSVVLFLIFLVGYLIYILARQIKEKKFNPHMTLSFLVPLIVLGATLLFMDIRLKQVKEGVDSSFFLQNTGWDEEDITQGNSFKSRLDGMRKTFDVFLQNPVIGVSLGGIAPWIAKTQVSNISSNAQVKASEGNNVLLEILAASGVAGFILFCAYMIMISRYILKKNPPSGDKDYYSGLFVGFILAFIMMIENQNILRPYIWAHIALISAFIRLMKDETTVEKKS
ncbi:MAG: O-antigen ligase family protein [Brevinematales bacterium]|nr:O-antigen ligase family protein [Brevinematales bacterium]